MRSDIKKPKVDLRNYYMLFLELGLVAALLVFIVATKVDFVSGETEINLPNEQEVTQMEEIVQTKQQEKPPPPPRPQVPVEVPNSEVIEDQDIDLDAEIDFDEPMDMPAPPPEKKVEEENEEDFFIAVEQMPKLKGSLGDLQKQLKYPQRAQAAGIEGRVIVQFIVNEEGEVEDPKVIRGIGGGWDEEALRVAKKAKFEPGRQRGNPVRVRYSLPFMFMLKE